MGKYYNPDGSSGFERKLKIQVWIANELAEANRLKRIEITRNYIDSELSHDPKELEKLLEDQA